MEDMLMDIDIDTTILTLKKRLFDTDKEILSKCRCGCRSDNNVIIQLNEKRKKIALNLDNLQQLCYVKHNINIYESKLKEYKIEEKKLESKIKDGGILYE